MSHAYLLEWARQLMAVCPGTGIGPDVFYMRRDELVGLIVFLEGLRALEGVL